MATHPDPLAHYATEGWTQGRDPNPMFSTSWYLTTYPDVVAAGVHPLEHYFADGASEGRDPGPGFDSDWYLATNADVRVAGVNPLGHFLTAGIHEGRRPRPRPVPTVAAAPRAVVLVSGEPATPGHQYRVVRVADAVRRLGGTAVVLDLPDASSTRISDLDAADVVVLWRTGWGDEVARVVERARAAGAAIVFDVDDLMVEPGIATLDVVDGIRSQGLTEQGAQEWFGKMARTASVADVCTASTEALALALRRLGKPTFVIPNGYDDETFVRSRLARRVRALSPTDGLCRIGYPSGSLTHQRDFAVAAPAVADVLRAHPHARLVLYRDAFVLDEFPEFDDLHAEVEWRDLVPLDALPTELARFDVNLAPLEVGNPFCEAKSALKFFEAALVDVPSVVSPTGPFRAVVTDGVDGFLAATVDDWRAGTDHAHRRPGASRRDGNRGAAAPSSGAAVRTGARRSSGRCSNRRWVPTAVPTPSRWSSVGPGARSRPHRRSLPRTSRCCTTAVRRRASRWSCPSTTTPRSSPRRSTRCSPRPSTTSTSWWSTTRPPTTRSPSCATGWRSTPPVSIAPCSSCTG